MGRQPAAEQGIVDCYELGGQIALLSELFEDIRVRRAAAMLPGDSLALIGVDAIQELRRHLAGPPLVRDRHRGLGQNGRGRGDNLELARALLDGKIGLVLPGQERVALAILHKRVGRAPRAAAVVNCQSIFDKRLFLALCQAATSDLIIIIGIRRSRH